MLSNISETVGGKFLCDLWVGTCVCLLSGGHLLLLGLPESSGSGLSLGFKGFDEFFLVPSVLVCKITENAEVSMLFHSENLESFWDNHSLLVIVWVWNSLENLQSIECGFTSW